MSVLLEPHPDIVHRNVAWGATTRPRVTEHRKRVTQGLFLIHARLDLPSPGCVRNQWTYQPTTSSQSPRRDKEFQDFANSFDEGSAMNPSHGCHRPAMSSRLILIETQQPPLSAFTRGNKPGDVSSRQHGSLDGDKSHNEGKRGARMTNAAQLPIHEEVAQGHGRTLNL